MLGDGRLRKNSIYRCMVRVGDTTINSHSYFSYMQHLTTAVPLAYEFSCFLDSLLRTVPQISRIDLKVLCRKYDVMFSWYSMRIKQAEKDFVEVQN